MTYHLDSVLVVWLGLMIGSFLNVLIYRIPRRKSFVTGRSKCPACEATIAWYHNIPLLSYLLLRGKCASCNAPISWKYPLVELLTGAAFLLIYSHFGFSWNSLIFAYLSAVLIIIFFIDLEFQLIPDSLTLPGVILGLLVSLLPEGMGILRSATGLLVGGGSLFLIATLGDWMFKKESMGGGDIKMAAMLGTFLGWQKMLFVFVASAGIGLVVSLVVMAISARMRQERVIPFGPFLALAAALAVAFGDQLIDFYLTQIAGLS